MRTAGPHTPFNGQTPQIAANLRKLGEPPEQAAVRELFEQTGRCGHVARQVKVQRYDLQPCGTKLQCGTTFRWRCPVLMSPSDGRPESRIRRLVGRPWCGTAGGFR
ncbi:NUDIX domain-containing protein [Rhodococcus sp. DMU2021]|uniref:NUDIX domain-containing protein n=1 Tax=Rhodococcus sp. DMU2021 TaxID=2866997 RepID=UPI0035A92839